MLRKTIGLAAFALLATSLSAQTAEQVVSNYIAARGGLEKIKSVKSERVTGTISFGTDAEGPFLVERQRPLKMYMQITLNGLSLIRVYDGKSAGWIYNPFPPNTNSTVEAMTDADLRNIFDEADFDGPFVDYKAKGNQIEFVDKEEVLGKTAYKLKLTNKLGDVSYFYFDASTNFLLKWEGDRKIGGQNYPWESFFQDIREINGLKYPFVIESDSPGTGQRQKISAEKIEVNVPLDAARFGKPNPPPAPAAATPAVPSAPGSGDSAAPPQKPNQ
jgi:outer membrane lipoprotein-sorting protein